MHNTLCVACACSHSLLPDVFAFFAVGAAARFALMGLGFVDLDTGLLDRLYAQTMQATKIHNVPLMCRHVPMTCRHVPARSNFDAACDCTWWDVTVAAHPH